jgi:hypothetical protein
LIRVMNDPHARGFRGQGQQPAGNDPVADRYRDRTDTGQITTGHRDP